MDAVHVHATAQQYFFSGSETYLFFDDTNQESLRGFLLMFIQRDISRLRENATCVSFAA
jgi:hypothetical protein